MEYQIKRGNVTIATVYPEGSVKKAVMGEDVVEMSFTLGSFIKFQIGDSVTVYGETYKMRRAPVWTEESTVEYKYQVTFESVLYDLDKVQFHTLDANNELKEVDFPLMGTAETFLDLIILNANRTQPGWVKGNVDVTEAKNLSFSKESCLRVLSRIAGEFNTEFWVDGKTIHLTRKGVFSGMELAYGEGNGLYNITQNNHSEGDVITRLYALGGNKNIPGDYRGFSSRLKMPVATGAFLENFTTTDEVIEHTEIFEDIYPRRIGTVSAVDAGNPLVFTDAAIDFDVNAQLIPGKAVKVTFITGQLAGWELELSSFDNATKTFRVIVHKEEKAVEVPSAILRPAIGDTYVLTDLIMPQQYIAAAELELQQKAQAFLLRNCVERVVHAVTIDSHHFELNQYSLVLGNSVRINDLPTGVDVTPRIISYTRDLHEPFLYPALELSESIQVAPFQGMSKQQQVIVAMQANKLFDPNTMRNNWRNIEEFFNMVFDPDGNYFSEKIKPLSIETTALSVGARSQQLELPGILFEANFQGNANDFRSNSGQLVHLTIETEPRTWDITASVYNALVSETAYYIYAKCERNGTAGSILLSSEKIRVGDDPDYFHFLLGFLNSMVNDVRGHKMTYGQATINGRFITAGRVTSQDGKTFVDLDTGEIAGRIRFGNNGTSTVIDGNLVTSTTLILGNGIIDNAGISGEGTLTSDIRFWAGASYALRSTAPFRVDQSGKVWMSNAVIAGEIIASSGSVGGFDILGGTNLNGSKVVIKPNDGIEITGYARFKGLMSIPHAEPALADMEAGEWYEWMDEFGAGVPGSVPPAIANLVDLQDVSITSRADGYVLFWNATTSKFEFKADGGGGTVDAWTKTEADARYLGINATAANSLLWQGQTYDASTYWAGSGFLMAYDSTVAKFRVAEVAPVRSWLGLGSAAYQSIYTLNWGGLTANFDDYGTTPVYLLGSQGGVARPYQASHIAGFLGLGSAAYLNASQANTGSTVVQRDAFGQIEGQNLNAAGYLNSVDDVDAGGIGYIMGKVGASNTIRSFSANYLKTFLGLGSNAFSSTAYLPLTGGTLSGSITMANGGAIVFNRDGSNTALQTSTANISGAGSTTDFNNYVYGNNSYGIWTNGSLRYTVDGGGNHTIHGPLTGTSATFNHSVYGTGGVKILNTGGAISLFSYADGGGSGWTTSADGVGYKELIYLDRSTASIQIYTGGNYVATINSSTASFVGALSSGRALFLNNNDGSYWPNSTVELRGSTNPSIAFHIPNTYAASLYMNTSGGLIWGGSGFFTSGPVGSIGVSYLNSAAGAEAGFYLQDNGTNYWEVYKRANGNFGIYNYNTGSFGLEIDRLTNTVTAHTLKATNLFSPPNVEPDINQMEAGRWYEYMID